MVVEEWGVDKPPGPHQGGSCSYRPHGSPKRPQQKLSLRNIKRVKPDWRLYALFCTYFQLLWERNMLNTFTKLLAECSNN